MSEIRSRLSSWGHFFFYLWQMEWEFRGSVRDFILRGQTRERAESWKGRWGRRSLLRKDAWEGFVES